MFSKSARRPRRSTQPLSFKLNAPALAIACALLAASAALPGVAWATQAAAEQNYAIPAGKLSDALAEFAAKAGVPLSFDPLMLDGLRSQELRGRYTVREGFTRLLSGSGYELADMGGGAYSLKRVPMPAAGMARETTELAPLTVTGTLYGSKETNSLNNSVASVGIVTADDIAEGQIRTYRDAFRRLGNVMDAAYADTGFIVRGINFEGFVPSGAPLGSLYIDGVLQTRDATRRGARGLWDVEQMEVYRGPQSTLSGRAAMAGSVYIKSKDPVFRKEGAASVTSGTEGLFNTALMFNAPVNDQIAVRFAGEFERANNSVHYPDYQGFDRVDELESSLYYNLRGKVLFAPSASPATLAVLSYAFTHDRPLGRDIGSGPGFGLDEKRGDYNIPAYVELRPSKVQNLGLEVTHEISDALRFTSQTGVNRSLLERRSVNEGTANEINTLRSNQKDLLMTQELRLNYEADRLRWVAGLFASRQQYDTWLDRTLFSLRNDKQTLTTDTTNLALFGELSWEFVPSYRVIVGGRVDYAKLKSSYINHRRQPLSAPSVVASQYDAQVSETNFVPRIGITKDFGERHTAGLTYSQGFRAGNFSYNTTTSQVYEYKPERANNLELSYKGRYLGDQLLLNANLFYTKYRDQQVEMRLDPADPFYREITNAASSRAWGLEVEPTWKVNERLSAFMSLAYLNSKFKEFDHYQYGNLSGQQFPEAPEWMLGLGGQYAFGNGFYVGADAKFTSSYLVRFGTPPQERLGSRTIVNLQVGYRAKNWEISAFAENLFDKRYYTTVDLGVSGVDYASLGAPRRIGVNLAMKF